MNKFCNNQDYSSIDDVSDAYPGATEIVAVEGGWMVFETATDYATWKAQE